MLRLLPLALIAALALPAAAQAAPVKLKTPAVSPGTLTVEVSNPNRYAVRGTAKLTVERRTVATRTVRIGKRATTKITFRTAAAGQATIVLKTKRAGARRSTTASKSVTLPKPTPAAPANPAVPTVTPMPAAPAGPTRWAGRVGTEGAYDDFELTRDGTTITLTKPALVPTSCAENGDTYDVAVSSELFDATGPWTIGTDGSVEKPGSVAVNQLVSGSPRTITYKVTETAADATRITGKLGLSFSESKLDIFNNSNLYFVNCFGGSSFEAIPAP